MRTVVLSEGEIAEIVKAYGLSSEGSSQEDRFFKALQAGFIQVGSVAYSALRFVNPDGEYAGGLVHRMHLGTQQLPAQALVLHQGNFVRPGIVLVQRGYGESVFEVWTVDDVLGLMDMQPPLSMKDEMTLASMRGTTKYPKSAREMQLEKSRLVGDKKPDLGVAIQPVRSSLIFRVLQEWYAYIKDNNEVYQGAKKAEFNALLKPVDLSMSDNVGPSIREELTKCLIYAIENGMWQVALDLLKKDVALPDALSSGMPPGIFVLKTYTAAKRGGMIEPALEALNAYLHEMDAPGLQSPVTMSSPLVRGTGDEAKGSDGEPGEASDSESGGLSPLGRRDTFGIGRALSTSAPPGRTSMWMRSPRDLKRAKSLSPEKRNGSPNILRKFGRSVSFIFHLSAGGRLASQTAELRRIADGGAETAADTDAAYAATMDATL